MSDVATERLQAAHRMLLLLLVSGVLVVAARLLAISVAVGRAARGDLLDRHGVVLAHNDPGARSRRYHSAAGLSHLLGGSSPNGPHGLERRYATELAAGETVQLTLDADLTITIYDRIASAAPADCRIRLLSIDLATRAVLVDTRFPGFDICQPEMALLSAIARAEDRYIEPGSLTKPLLLARAWQLDRFPADVLAADGPIDYRAAERIRSLTEIIARSENSGAQKLGLELGRDEIVACFESFGLIGSSADGRRGLVALDQGIDSLILGDCVAWQPDRVLAAYAALVHDGRLRPLRWHRGESLTSGPDVLSPAHVQRMRRVLFAVTTFGTASTIDNEHLPILGKTGSTWRRPGRHEWVAWFVGAAPAEDPKVAVAVVLITAARTADTVGGHLPARLAQAALELHVEYLR